MVFHRNKQITEKNILYVLCKMYKNFAKLISKKKELKNIK